MPIQKSFAHWNFKMIDPSGAVFAQEVLNSKQNNILDFNIETPLQQSIVTSKSHSRISQSNSSFEKKSTNSSMMKRKAAADTSFSSDMLSSKPSRMNRINRSKTNKESHPAGLTKYF